jgi:hypothetical protein
VRVPQDGKTPAARVYCEDHRELHRPHRRRDVAPNVRTRWINDQARRMPTMP